MVQAAYTRGAGWAFVGLFFLDQALLESAHDNTPAAAYIWQEAWLVCGEGFPCNTLPPQ